MQHILCDSINQQGQGIFGGESLLADFIVFYCMVGAGCNSFLLFDLQRENVTVLTQRGANSLQHNASKIH